MQMKRPWWDHSAAQRVPRNRAERKATVASTSEEITLFLRAVQAIRPPWMHQMEWSIHFNESDIMHRCRRLAHSNKEKHRQQMYREVWGRYLLERMVNE